MNFKIKSNQGVFFGNSEDHALTQISDTYITFIPNGSTWFDGLELKYGAVLVGYGNGSGLSWLQGGMNEEGLAFDSTSVPYTTPNLHNERETNLVPEIFSCKTINEVIEYKNTHNIYQQEGRVQSFYADKLGESVVFNIGKDGEFDFFPNNETFQLASNFYYDNPSRGNPSSDAIRRYNAAEERLKDIVTNDNITIESIATVLNAVHFEGPRINTLYSNIFDVTNGDIYLYFFHQFEEVVKLNLEEELAKGRHTYQISDLFTQELVDKAFNEYNEYSILIKYFPMDIIFLMATIILDIILSIYILYLIIKKIFYKISKSNQLNKLKTNDFTVKGRYTEIIFSCAIIWSFLSFPMIYWNRYGEWWPFFDDIPILNWSLQPFYAFYNLFLLISISGIILTSFLLFSFTNKGKLISLVKSGLNLGLKEKWRYVVNLSIPIFIGIIFLYLEIITLIPKIDWLMFIILYPLIVIMLIILIPLVKKKDKEDQESPQFISKINLLKEGVYLILIWAISFLPLLLTGILDQTYIFLLINLSISLVCVMLFEVFFSYRKNIR
jgi:hypothetical protein